MIPGLSDDADHFEFDEVSDNVSDQERMFSLMFTLGGLRRMAGASARSLGCSFLLAAAGLALAAEPAWVDVEHGRYLPLTIEGPNRTGFTPVAPGVSGAAFTNLLSSQRQMTNQVLLNGSGVAAGDVDGDGWCDLYFCGLDNDNRLYRNLGGWRFEDVTAQAGVACPGVPATGAVLADLNGDARLDLVVNSVGSGTFVFLNDGQGHFRRWKQHLNLGKGGTSLALGDLDGDGFLDLYVANYRTSALMDMPETRFWIKPVQGRQMVVSVNGRPVTEPDLANRFVVTEKGGISELGELDVLYRNVGGTNLVLAPFAGGIFLDEDGKPLAAPPFDWGLSVMIRDLNGDGWPDIYVCNDFDTVDRVWLNMHNGQFHAIPRLALRKSSRFSMGVDMADINRDGFDDIFVLDMLSRDHVRRMNMVGDRNPPVPQVGEIENRPEYMINTLFLNRRDGSYAEIGQLSGVAASEWSWTPVFLDVDLDGYEDLLICNGNERDGRNMDITSQLRAMRMRKKLAPAEILANRKIFPRLATPNLAFRNRGDLTFEEVGAQWGFALAGVSHGMALADLDNDGDLDVAINNLNMPASLLRNDSIAPRVAVRLEGVAPNTHGIGATIKVRGGAVPLQSQQMVSGGRYLSSDDTLRTFAAGSPTNDMSIEVNWRSGKRTIVHGVKANRLYAIRESDAAPVSAKERTEESNVPQPLFENQSRLLAHTHADEPFDDYARQPLLPRRLSQLGPGLAWFDMDGDGLDELIVGSGKGGRLAVFHNDGQGKLSPWNRPPLNRPITRDQTTVLGWHASPQEIDILAGSANYEDGLALGSCVRRFVPGHSMIDDDMPGMAFSVGPLAMADVDNDGDLDLFVGGRCVPGRYPEPASSVLFRNEHGRLQLDEEASRAWTAVGLVSGAIFSDLDGDGRPELVLACEWGPLRVYHFAQGRWQETTAAFGLERFNGWWNGVAAGDFDGDGRIDLVGSNWGRNTRYESHREKPLQVFYGDLGGAGSVDLILAYEDVRMKKVVPEFGLDFLAQGLPFLRARFTSYQAFGEAGVEDVLGDRLGQAKRLEANWLETTVFLNRGGRFEARPLPVEAQMAPAFGVCVGDVDGDGAEDIFLSQNFFDAQPETPRYDGGYGLWLKGDGRGGFRALSGNESGVRIWGEQRGCAVADYDADGRLDLAVSQNGAATQLFRNVRGRPGLRVKLQGPPGNPASVGAALRLGEKGQWGPVREIHAGSGYWSQDSAAQVLNVAGRPDRLWVRWPGGKVTETPLAPDLHEVVLGNDGNVQ